MEHPACLSRAYCIITVLNAAVSLAPHIFTLSAIKVTKEHVVMLLRYV